MTRAAAILDVLAEDSSVAFGPSELARRLGLPKSSIANICVALADAGLIRRIGTGFSLGRKLAELGGAYLTAVDVVQEFYDACRQLPTGSEETVQLAVLDGVEMTYLARHDGRQQVRLTSGIGRRLPAQSTATGKAALASLDDAELERRLATITTFPAITPALPPVAGRPAGRPPRRSASAATRSTTRRPSKGSCATASSSRPADRMARMRRASRSCGPGRATSGCRSSSTTCAGWPPRCPIPSGVEPRTRDRA